MELERCDGCGEMREIGAEMEFVVREKGGNLIGKKTLLVCDDCALEAVEEIKELQLAARPTAQEKPE